MLEVMLENVVEVTGGDAVPGGMLFVSACVCRRAVVAGTSRQHILRPFHGSLLWCGSHKCSLVFSPLLTCMAPRVRQQRRSWGKCTEIVS